ncbi:Domain of unknown function (DUF4114) [Orpheovirus IHUMI-LCC2]|uniref:DUF4114 domain-containing protein n=1 Tax=Orpheovirus IHUMI-LCC2 TaxID=2023057 RepID=A0A2I2L613_9VIRU|nr:Domain of unknown function (DUF4114) [Orpheovirus IHUMI-LCC2]SNW62956.1 Domain of unknown function (DUF4114) [Orpheovirus IHUMI-LCC2]
MATIYCQCPINSFNTTVHPNVVTASYDLFPESKVPHAALIDNSTLTFTTTSNVTFTFLREGAGYRNTFGYFLMNSTHIISRETVFSDVTWISEGGCLYTGISVKYGPFQAGIKMGFWVKANGYNNPNTNDIWYSVRNSFINNNDGKDHIARVRVPTNGESSVIILGFEDLNGLGDTDYNDVMFYTTVDGSYSEEIPIYNNGTLQVCSNSTISQYKEVARVDDCIRLAVMEDSSLCSGYVQPRDGWRIATWDDVKMLDIYSLFPSVSCLVVRNNSVLVGIGCQPNIKILASCYNTGCESNTRILLTTTDTLPLESCTVNSGQVCTPIQSSTIIRTIPSQYLPLPVYPQELTIRPVTSSTLSIPVTLNPSSSTSLDLFVVVDSGIEPSGSGGNSFKTELTRLINRLISSNKFGSIRVGLVTVTNSITIRPLSYYYSDVLIPVSGSGLSSSRLSEVDSLLSSYWSDNMANLRVTVALSSSTTLSSLSNTLLVTNCKFISNNVVTKYFTEKTFDSWGNSAATQVISLLSNIYISYTNNLAGPSFISSALSKFNITYNPSTTVGLVNIYGNGRLTVNNYVNTPPSFLISTQNRNVIIDGQSTFTVNLQNFIQDVDNDLLIMSLVSSDIPVTLNGFTYTINPLPEYLNSTKVIKFKVTDGCAESEIYVERLTFVQTDNRSPVAVDRTIRTKEDTPVSFLLTGYDPDFIFGDTVTLKVLDTTGYGTYSIPTDFIYSGQNYEVTFTPQKDYSSNNPAGYLKYQAVDSHGFISDLATITIYVDPVDDNPRYTGSTNLETFEDTSLTVDVFSQVIDVDSPTIDYNLVSVQYGGRGSFNFTSGVLTYIPLPDDNGDFIAYFIVTISGEIYNVSITVIPVNDPPVLIPLMSKYVEVLEDEWTYLQWEGTDIDSPLSSLTSVFVSKERSSYIRNFLRNDDDSILSEDGVVQAYEPGKFRIKFVPAPNYFDLSKVGNTFYIYVLDDYKASSDRYLFQVRVLPVNDPPIISGPSSISLPDPFGVSITDIDILRGMYSVNITCTDGLIFKNDTYDRCDLINSRLVSCYAVQRDIDRVVNSIKYMSTNESSNTSEEFNFYVSDLGNTDYLNRELTTNKTITVRVSFVDGLVDGGNTDNSLAIGLGVGLGGAGALALAALIWKLTRNNTSTDQYFESLFSPDASSGTNPIYSSAGTEGLNPLYAPK